MADIVDIVPELKDCECLRIVDRHKRTFSYPMHRHNVMELNFIERGNGARRIVRDSSESIGDYDLVMFGNNLEHSWDQGTCSSADIRELTVHFDGDIFLKGMQGKRVFESVNKMLKESSQGLSFGMPSVLSIYNTLNRLVGEKDQFEQIILFERIIYELAKSPYRVLTRMQHELPDYSIAAGKVAGLREYVRKNYHRNLQLKELVEFSGLPSSSLNRLFKMHTGMTVYNYLIQVRLEKAARRLIDTADKISDIARQCGFCNISNFNRAFKANCNVTPREYREAFQKDKQSV